MTVPETNHQESYLLSRWIYLRSLGMVHFVAYLSLSVQILMLNGKNGILPIATMLRRVKDVYGDEAYGMLPTIFWLNSSDPFILAACIAGIVLSVLVVSGVMTGPALLLLAVLYSSLDNGSGEFMAFGSDGLIIEATILALFMVPWCLWEWGWNRDPGRVKEPSTLALALNRFLLFRLMFGAGLVKILSGDPYWKNLTALSYHQETQPIPSPLAWFIHHFPLWVHKTACVFTFVAELVSPFLYFSQRRLRLLAAALTVALHVGILLTGNYTFLNYLSIVLCIPLIDDAWLERIVPYNWAVKLRALLFQQPSVEQVSETIVSELKSRSLVSILSRFATTSIAALFLFLGGCQFITGFIGSYIFPTALGRILTVLAPYRIFNSYGMFAVMTTTRPEIVFEGSMDGKKWVPYTFKYKVDDICKPPPVVAPHMPRLDWRLWFAAMRDVSENPWVLNLVRLMLKGDPAVLSAFKTNPFPSGGPKYIRAYVYDYHFSDWEALSQRGEWWRRDNKLLYIPPVELDDTDEVVPATAENP
ncbi:lipase maturation factor family protein [Candidatus Obscuribacterales bacterium]|nr:lipase maturation factor family protein [Candidatus Obscuribacterales bacterium]